MNTQTCRIVYEDGFTSGKANYVDATAMPFLNGMNNISGGINAGRDLNKITEKVRECYEKGYQTLEIVVSQEFYEQVEEKVQLILAYFPFQVIVDPDQEAGSVTLRFNYDIEKPSLKPIKWLFVLSDNFIINPDNPFAAKQVKDLPAAERNLAYVKNIRHTYTDAYGKGLHEIEFIIDKPLFEGIEKELIENMENMSFAVEYQFSLEQDSNSHLKISFPQPRPTLSVDDIPVYLTFLTSADWFEKDDLSTFKKKVAYGNEVLANEITIEMDPYRYDRISRRMEQALEDSDVSVFLRIQDRTPEAIKILVTYK